MNKSCPYCNQDVFANYGQLERCNGCGFTRAVGTQRESGSSLMEAIAQSLGSSQLMQQSQQMADAQQYCQRINQSQMMQQLTARGLRQETMFAQIFKLPTKLTGA